MSNSTIKISKNITKDRLPVQKKKKKKLMIIKNEAWQFSNIENSRAKENTCPSPMTKSFHSAIFDSKRASVIDPPTNCISLLFMIRVVNSTNKSMGERGEKKNSPVRWKSFENTPSVGRWRKLKQSRCL